VRKLLGALVLAALALSVLAAPALAADLPLEVAVTGEGGVSSSPAGIGGCTEALSPCEAEFEEGSTVTLTATPAAGSELTGWTGCTSETGSECQVLMSAAASVTATFAPGPQLPLVIEVEGAGEVTGTGIACTEAAGSAACEEDFAEGTQVAIAASPAIGSHFIGWTTTEGNAGTCTGTVSSCQAGPLTAATKLKATFAPTTTSPLTAVVTGHGAVSAGSGTISGCREMGGVACEGEYEGTVTLTGTPDAGYVLAGWIGCKHTTATSCQVTVSEATEVTAIFLQEGTGGATGPAGPAGPAGPSGPGGSNGANGSAGARGSDGAAGAQGQVGGRGALGAQGPAGPQGPAGASGKVACEYWQRQGKLKVKCKVTYSTPGKASRVVGWGLMNGGRVVRSGTSRGGNLRIRLGGLEPGRYRLLVDGHLATVILIH
jgi:hypothetical protein